MLYQGADTDTKSYTLDYFHDRNLWVHLKKGVNVLAQGEATESKMG